MTKLKVIFLGRQDNFINTFQIYLLKEKKTIFSSFKKCIQNMKASKNITQHTWRKYFKHNCIYL